MSRDLLRLKNIDKRSEIGVTMCDCELPEFFNTNIVKARKPHQCFECGKAILIGESYWFSSGQWSGYFEMFHTCIECEVLRFRLQKESKCCVAYGQIYEALMENRNGWGPDGRAFWKKHRRFNEQQREHAALKAGA